MTTVGVTVPAQWGASEVRLQVRGLGSDSDEDVFNAPVAPRRVTYGGFENTLTEMERVGRTTLMRPRGKKPRTMSMEVAVFRHGPDGRLTPIALPYLKPLARLAERKGRVKVLYDRHSSACEWVIQTMMFESTHRNRDDEVTSAIVTLEFVEAVTLADVQAPQNQAGGGGAVAGWKTYTLKAKDTPRSVSKRFYDSEKWWRKILDANGLTPAEFRAKAKRGWTISIPKPTWR